MQIRSCSANIGIVILALLAVGCGEQIGQAVEEAVVEARLQLQNEPIDLSNDDLGDAVQLTPDGDLVINGRAVPMDDAQRGAALAYREKLLAVADAGLLVGQQGAAIGGEAVALALSSLFGDGDVDAEETKRKIEGEAEKIKTAARALCRDALALVGEQARFAELVPEFAPYTKQVDIDADCEYADSEREASGAVSL